MHPTINREKTVVRVFIRNVWKVAFEQWIERLQHIFVRCCRVGFNGFPRYRNKILIMITVIIYYSI